MTSVLSYFRRYILSANEKLAPLKFQSYRIVSFICVSPVYTLKHILHIKLTYTYTTDILKELRETIRVTDFKYIQFKSYIHMK